MNKMKHFIQVDNIKFVYNVINKKILDKMKYNSLYLEAAC